MDINYTTGNVRIGGVNTLYKLNVKGSFEALYSIVSTDLYISSRAGIGGFNDGTCSLFVNGLIQSNGVLNIIEQTGTVSSPNIGSIILDHENNGGASSTTFRSKVNRGSDYGYIEYQDASVINGGGESARLIIGVQNDGDDHICLMPSGNVGIGLITPPEKLEVQGSAVINGAMISYDVRNTNHIDTALMVATGNITAQNSIFATNNVSANRFYATNNVYINHFNCPCISYLYTSVSEYNGSRQINIPIRATNAFVYLYFNDLASHVVFLKEGNSYHKVILVLMETTHLVGTFAKLGLQVII